MLSVNVRDKGLVLCPLCGQSRRLCLVLPLQVSEIGFQFVAHVDRSAGISGFEGHQFNQSLLVLHLPVNGDCPALGINVFPFQAVTLVNAQAATAPQQIGGFRICAFEVFIQPRHLVRGKGHDFRVLVHLHFWHTDSNIFVHAEFVVGVYFQIVAGIGLPENQIEHFQEGFHILVGPALCIIQVGEIVVDLCNADFINVTPPKLGAKVIVPNAVLLADSLICLAAPPLFTIFLVDLLEGLARHGGLPVLFLLFSGDRRRPCQNRGPLGGEQIPKLVLGALSVFLLALHREGEAVSPIPVWKLIHARVILLCHCEVTS